MYDVVKLIGVTVTYDDIGNAVETPIETEVYVDIQSVTQTEFFQAGQSGLKPQYKMTMFAFDYNNQEIVEYNNKRYAVYRTYMVSDDIELYLTEKVGV